MGIEKIFDNTTSPVLNSLDLIGKENKLVDVCVATFSIDVYNKVLSTYPSEFIGPAGTGDGTIHIHVVDFNGKKIGFYKTPIGAPWASMILEDAHNVLGATKFLVFGSCGVIGDVDSSKLIVPTESYRDEGTSYHYVPASDTIKIKNSAFIANILNELNVPYVSGKAWTTDGFYRETAANVAKRKEQGCLVVEMESAALQAVCDNKGFEFYTFFFGGDVLKEGNWNQGNLSNSNEITQQKSAFDVAIEIAIRL